MSSPIWTPAALRSEAAPYAAHSWRLVEAQHIVSTLKLVDTVDELDILESLLEDSKPPLPIACRHLNYLLSTPFRYRAYPHGSRFRRAGMTPGVWYGAERAETSVAEMAFYRCLFYAESPSTPFPVNAAAYTAFSASIQTTLGIDLTAGAFAKDAPLWENPTDFGACQQIAAEARTAGVEAIRYRSVRDPDGGAALAVLTCDAFAAPAPIHQQTWYLRISPTGVVAMREFPRYAIQFATDAFDADLRLSGMIWNR